MIQIDFKSLSIVDIFSLIILTIINLHNCSLSYKLLLADVLIQRRIDLDLDLFFILERSVLIDLDLDLFRNLLHLSYSCFDVT